MRPASGSTSDPVLIVSRVIPPAPSGQSVAIGRLVEGAPLPVVYATQDAADSDADRADALVLRRARFHGPDWLPAILGKPVSTVLTAYSLLHRTMELTRWARRWRVSVIVACTAGPTELLAAWLSAMMLRRPLIAYLFDDPIYQWPAGPIRRFAAMAERLWTRGVAAVLVPNEAMAEAFERRTTIRPLVIRNSIPASLSARPPARAAGDDIREPVRIVYTGAVYAAQADAVANVATALRLTRHRVELHIFTSQTAADLRDRGLDRPGVVLHGHVAPDESVEIQRSADLVLLPLAFRSTIPEVIVTSAPGKLGEYLASGRPMLVHAPAGSWVADFVTEHRAGAVVVEDDPAEVAAAIDDIIEDRQLRERLSESARQTARLFVDVDARERFWEVIRQVGQSHGGRN